MIVSANKSVKRESLDLPKHYADGTPSILFLPVRTPNTHFAAGSTKRLVREIRKKR